MNEVVVLLLQWFKPVAIYSTVALSLFKIGVAFWWRPHMIQRHFYRQGIRGPPYRFFIGNLKDIVTMMNQASSQPMPFSHNILPRVLSFYHHWKKIYGSTFLVWFGPTVRLTVSDPDLIREIFMSRSELFEKSDQHPLVKQLEGDGLLSLKGEKWAHHRRIMTPAFYMENLKMLAPVVANSVMEMLDQWTSMISEAGEVEIEVLEWFQNLTEDVITRTAFGTSYPDGKAIFRLQAQQMAHAAEAFRTVFIPGYSFLPTKRNMAAWKLDREVRKSLVKLIESREQECLRGHEGEQAKDLLGMMIEASGWCPDMTKEDILEECKGFFFAGKHSTSNMLTWTTILLAMHPQWQLLARDELSRVCGSRVVPTRDDLVKLKTLTMIVNESLRLYPPVIAMIRRAKVEAELGGSAPRSIVVYVTWQGSGTFAGSCL
ncbi:hypothetical protein MLD38_014996 [Melastoma candidum]|uniref:Uncharacterized protein n=1 Tax=Melastoma candidum TaxID=119954 RepID=A0ACB9RDX4_9MYRT|nr:hypothetical protein MLD38_014996 [Melastoma candidum]